MDLKNILEKTEIKSILSEKLLAENQFVFDFTNNNKDLLNIDVSNAVNFSEYIFKQMEINQAKVGIGKYDEDRLIYRKSSLFQGENCRSIHLGIDLFTKPGVEVFAPIFATVHSFALNDNFGDYGPTIILEHNIGGYIFYTLYGHLTLDSIQNLNSGMQFFAGQKFAKIGDYPINGNWPAHLHFQIITDMQGKKGDFPGVANIGEREVLLKICPDPNLILQIAGLE